MRVPTAVGLRLGLRVVVVHARLHRRRAARDAGVARVMARRHDELRRRPGVDTAAFCAWALVSAGVKLMPGAVEAHRRAAGVRRR